jgi:hypothetical protein
MTQNVDPIFALVPKTVASQITASDTTSNIVVYTAGANGGAVVSLAACSFDASDMVLVVSVNTGSVVRVLGSVTIPALSGTDGTVGAFNVFTKANIPALQSDGSLILEAGDTLEVAALVTVTGNVDITGIAGDY